MTIVDGMRQEEIWDADAARSYDTPGSGMFAPEILVPMVDRLADLAAGGRALEFAAWRGRRVRHRVAALARISRRPSC